ncbi:MAG: bile acid:sodium symporter family protein [Planctomycetota bacterium]|nr:bile acid:sodium symporter family protein [Planctomycetota bacterium]
MPQQQVSENALPKETKATSDQEQQPNPKKNSGSLDFSMLWLLVVASSLILVSIAFSFQTPSLACWLSAVGIVLASLSVAFHTRMQTYAFASWVICFVAMGILFPRLFLDLGLSPNTGAGPSHGVKLLPYLIQVAMFGMGATLTFGDFARILQTPWPIAVGFVLQFSCMPLLGWSVSRVLQLPPEIALGVILVGSCPGGVASNVITYLAKGNVALSVTMTACTTLAAPVMTPLMMYLLAGKSIPINYWEMMVSIFMTVFVPVVAGLVCNVILTRMQMATKRAEQTLAMLSMLAICLVCGVIASNSADAIRSAGFILVLAVLLHNNLGYLLGYWGAKLAGCNEADSRTIAIEVGLQNGGMAANLATTVIKNTSAAVAPALFGPLMNVTGSVLAAWWSRNASTLEKEA